MKTLIEICHEIGAKIEPYQRSEPVSHTVPGSNPLRSEVCTGDIMLVTYDPHKVPAIYDVFGRCSDARLVGCVCGPLVLLERI